MEFAKEPNTLAETTIYKLASGLPDCHQFLSMKEEEVDNSNWDALCSILKLIISNIFLKKMNQKTPPAIEEIIKHGFWEGKGSATQEMQDSF